MKAYTKAIRSSRIIAVLLVALMLVMVFMQSSFAASSEKNMPTKMGTVEYTYNDRGLIQTATEGDDRIEYTYTYYGNGMVKTRTTEYYYYDELSPERTEIMKLNKYGAVISQEKASGDYKMTGKPVYYKGTHKLKTLKATIKVKAYNGETATTKCTLTFNKSGYLTKYVYNNSETYKITYNKKGRTLVKHDLKYKYKTKDGKISTIKRYWNGTNQYVDTIRVKAWTKTKVGANAAKSARILSSVYEWTNFEGSTTNMNYPSMIYQWK
ncbi:MAG: hypothetical protein IJJ06_12135 [Mogibacterium sp.]|nr:hypothetical protein [Mogibacterium sp.]MBR0342945.1 hypothetical protein [Oscillospiraceae bacterium]